MNLKLDHINLTVSDLDASIDWYSKIFGFKLVEYGGRGTPESKRWAIVACNDSMICMGEWPKRKNADEKISQDTFHKIYHFGIRIFDIKLWEKKIQQHNIKIFYGGVSDYTHSKSWYVRDPNGHEIEVSYTDAPELKFPNIELKGK